MIEIKNEPVSDPPDRNDIRTLQALDQAAGGSGNIASVQGEQASSAEIRPDHGTDDARCEDSAERDLQRRQTADKVSARISDIRTAPGLNESDEDAVPEDHFLAPSARMQARMDGEIRTEIEGRLKADRLLKQESIFVTVSRGRVIVEGSVENHEAKQRAEAISWQASRIVAPDSNLTVRKSS